MTCTIRRWHAPFVWLAPSVDTHHSFDIHLQLNPTCFPYALVISCYASFAYYVTSASSECYVHAAPWTLVIQKPKDIWWVKETHPLIEPDCFVMLLKIIKYSNICWVIPSVDYWNGNILHCDNLNFLNTAPFSFDKHSQCCWQNMSVWDLLIVVSLSLAGLCIA